MQTRPGHGLGIGLIFGTVSLALTTNARAADPVTAGAANIGTHPNYPGYTAFWRTGKDYAVLGDDTNTYVNAPSKQGYVILRGANTDWMHVSKYGAWLALSRFQNSWLSVGEYSTQNNDGVASIGNHPDYGRGYAGFWLSTPNLSTKHWDYSLLTDGAHTFLNAPAREGILYFRSGNEENMSLTRQALVLNTASASKPGGGAWQSTSDIRVKKDVSRFELGLSELEKVRPVTFRYNGLGGTTASDRQFVGVVAQELEKALPFMVSAQAKKLKPEDKNTTDIKQVDPSAFTYLLINAVQELSRQNQRIVEENRQMKRVLCKSHPKEALCSAQ